MTAFGNEIRVAVLADGAWTHVIRLVEDYICSPVKAATLRSTISRLFPMHRAPEAEKFAAIDMLRREVDLPSTPADAALTADAAAPRIPMILPSTLPTPVSRPPGEPPPGERSSFIRTSRSSLVN